MSNRHDYYFLQPVSESELDDGFAELEAADRALMLDQGLVGIFQGGAAAQHSPVANLTIDVGGPMYAYDNFGQRIYIPGPSINVNVAQDSSSVSTAVAGGSNEKWVSIAIKFARVLSDPRVDGNSATVYFRRDESYEVVVTQGGEAATGTATRPSLDPDAVLLCDVLRTFGQTQVLNADIDTDRRQDVFVITGAPGGLSIRAGTLLDATAAMLEDLNDHILGIAGAHPATGIDADPPAAWADAAVSAGTTVQARLDNIIADLVLTTTAHSGGHKVGIAARSAWLGGRTNTASTIYGAIDKIITDLAVTTASDDGAERIGAQATAGSPSSLSSGSIRSQLDALLVLVNARARLVGDDTITGNTTFDGSPDVTGDMTVAGVMNAQEYDINTGSFERVQESLIADMNTGTVFIDNTTVLATETRVQQLNVPNGAILTAVKASIDPVNATPPAGTKPRITVAKRNLVTGASTTIIGPIADATAGAGYGAAHQFSSGAFTETIDRTKYKYFASLDGESGSGSNSLTFYGFSTVETVGVIDPAY